MVDIFEIPKKFFSTKPASKNFPRKEKKCVTVMIEMMTKFMLAGTLVMLCAPVAQCKCQPFSFKLDSSRLDPCGSFTVSGEL